MKGSPLRYVIDANILIDLRNGNLLSHFFGLNVHLSTPDVVVEEISGSLRALPQQYELRVEELSIGVRLRPLSQFFTHFLK